MTIWPSKDAAAFRLISICQSNVYCLDSRWPPIVGIPSERVRTSSEFNVCIISVILYFGISEFNEIQKVFH